MTITNLDMQLGTTRFTGSGTTIGELDAYYKGASRQRETARVSTNTKLPRTNKVTPPLVTALMDNGASMEEASTRIVDKMGEQIEQMSIRMSELERSVHVERESLREEINRNRQEVNKSEKRLKDRTDKLLVRIMSQMKLEAEEREKRLRSDLEQVRCSQEQTIGTLDTWVDAMLERSTQAIMDSILGKGVDPKLVENTQGRLAENRE